MSAYIVSKAHIDALVRLAVEGPAGYHGGPGHSWSGYYYHDGQSKDCRHEDAERIGAMLTAENVRSVSHRYNGEGLDTLPGPIDNGWVTDALLGKYAYPAYGTGPVRISRGPRHLTAIEGLKALDGYEYQSCEHPGWSSSEAKSLCDSLRSRLIDRLPGYSEADTWSISEGVPA